MHSSVIVWLVRKDLYLNRQLIGGLVLIGLITLAMVPFGGGVGNNTAGILFLCTLITLNVLLVVYGVVAERREKTLLFALSLPVSTADYLRAKLLFQSVAFFGPWLLLTAAAVLVINFTDYPHGAIPFVVILLAYVLCYYCILLVIALIKESAAWNIVTIVIGNVTASFLSNWVRSVPSIAANVDGPHAVWTWDVLLILATEIGCGLAALCVGYVLASRKELA